MYRLSQRPARHLYGDGLPEQRRQHRAAAWGSPDVARPATGAVRELAVDRLTSVIALEGECDIALAPSLSRHVGAALEAGRARLVVDLCAATFVEVTVLTALLHAHRRVAELGGRMAVSCAAHEVLDCLAASGLDDVFDVYPSREEALASLVGSAAAA